MAAESEVSLLGRFEDTLRRLSQGEVVDFSSDTDILKVFDDIAARRRKKKPRRPPEERGMPDDQAIRDLAEAYLDEQSRHWSQIVPLSEKGRVSRIEDMVREFKQRYVADDPFEDLVADSQNTACAYLRYSCDNSNPRSLAQQLRLILGRAAHDGQFIAWQYVFADAAITGMTAARRGYSMAKDAVESPTLGIQRMYIDEIGRASRDMIEALSLGLTIIGDHKRLQGVSDGFDSDAPLAKIQLMMFAGLQELFIDQLKAKVHRGMNDAFRRNDNVGLHPAGYRLEKMLDAAGNEILKANGRVKKRLVVDAAGAAVLLTVFTMFVIDRKSPPKIAEFLNSITFWGSKSWDGARVHKLLSNYHYVGIKIRRKTYQIRDRKSGKVTVVKRPRKEWKVRRLPKELRIIPWRLFKQAQKLLRKASAAFQASEKTGARNHVYSQVLFRPICDDCGAAMIFGRSGRYGTYVCGNSQCGRHDCKSKGHKSRRIVEESLLGEIMSRINEPVLAQRLLTEANQFLETCAAAPPCDTSKLEKDMAKVRSGLKRLVKLSIAMNDDEFQCDVVGKEMKSLQIRLRELQRQKDAASKNNAPVPEKVTPEEVGAALDNLRELLQGDVSRAAEVLRLLTGPIRIKQSKGAGKRGWDWTAHFTMNLIPVIAQLERGRNCPRSSTWVYLNTRDWTIQNRVVVRIQIPSPVEEIAEKLKEIDVEGEPKAAVLHLARSLNTSSETVTLARRLNSGQSPQRRSRGKPLGKRVVNRCPATPERIAEVVDLRIGKKWSFPRIGRKLGISEDKARSWFDRGNPQRVTEAIAESRSIDRGGYSHLGPEKYEEIRNLLSLGMSKAEVAKQLRVGKTTVWREARRIKAG